MSQMRMLSSYLFPHTDSKRPPQRKHDSHPAHDTNWLQCSVLRDLLTRFIKQNEEEKEKSSNNMGNLQKKKDPWRDSYEVQGIIWET